MVMQRIATINEEVRRRQPPPDPVPSTDEMPIPMPPLEEVAREMPKARIPTLTPIQRLVALQRKYALTYPGEAIPESLEELGIYLLPKGLKRKELKQYLYGAMEEAKIAYLRILNTSWTLSALDGALNRLGLANALKAFAREDQGHLQSVIRYLPEGK